MLRSRNLEQQIKDLKVENERSVEEIKKYQVNDELYRAVIKDINLTIEEKEKENQKLIAQKISLLKKIQGHDSNSWVFDVGEAGTYKSMAKLIFSQTEYGDYLLTIQYHNKSAVVPVIDVTIMMHRRHKNRLVVEYMVS
jgi:hypothetical protein